jgi:prophage regulatory protein
MQTHTHTKGAERLPRAIPPDLPGSAWLKLEQVLLYVPVSRSHWFHGVREGFFPKPVKAGRLSFWTAKDIRRLLERGSLTIPVKKKRATLS